MYVYQSLENRKKKKMPIFLFITFLVALAGSYFGQIYLNDIWGTENNGTVERVSYEVSDEKNFLTSQLPSEDMIAQAMKSVVGISKLQANEESIFDVSLSQKWGLGTGIIVSENGYVLTNQHLAGKVGTRLIVNLENGENVQGRVMWTQNDIDLAIIKMDRNGLNVATLGDSDTIMIGNEVWAIGNPLGVEFQRTTTRGIISGINRTLTFTENGQTIFMEDLIQTDASINSGNSGGPLINAQGEVIGINTVKITTAEGIGFAVPINIVKPIIDSFVENNSFIEVTLGIHAYDKEIVRYVNSKITIENGIYVTNVSKGSSAEDAGIKVGDIIISIDGIEVNKMTDLRRYIYTKKTGDVVSLVINRKNKIENVKVELKS